MIRIVVLLFSLLLPLQASASSVLVDVQASEGTLQARLLISGETLLLDEHGQPQLTAADQLRYTLTVSAPEEMEISLPSLSGPSFGDFSLLDQGDDGFIIDNVAAVIHQAVLAVTGEGIEGDIGDHTQLRELGFQRSHCPLRQAFRIPGLGSVL